jgi:inhibitor of cysteine peptidase
MIRVPAILILAASILITGCARTLEPTPPPEAPVSSDNEVSMPSETEPGGVRGPVYVDSTELLMLESYPVKVRLQVSGALPTPCHALQWEVMDPDPDGRIEVVLFSLADPELACIQVLEPFETSIPLGAFESGSYTVYLNGEGVGEFEL